MKRIRNGAALGLMGALAALLYLSGCAGPGAQIEEPSAFEGRPDLSVAPEQRQAAGDAIKAGVSGMDAARSLYLLGLADYQDAHYPDAGNYFLRISKDFPNSGWDRDAIFMMGAVLEKMNDTPRAIAQYQRLVESPTPGGTFVESPLSQASRRAVERLIQGPLALDQIDVLLRYPVLPDFVPELLLARIRLFVQEATASPMSATAAVDAAFQGIDDFNRRYPQSPYAKDLEKLAHDAEASVPVDKHSLGLLLPLSGNGAAIGQQLEQGVQLAIDDANQGLADADKIKLVILDEGSDSVSAEAAASKLILDDQVIGIIGPMSSDACLAVLSLANARRTPLLSPFAIRSDLSQISPYFFRSGMTLEEEGLAMADHTVSSLKVTRVAELYRDDAYGRTLAAAFAQRVSELGGTVAASLSYTTNNSDFKDLFVQLGGVDPGVLKDADADEKRDEELRVEAASTVLGRPLMQMKAAMDAQSPSPEPGGDTADAYRPLTFPARVAIFDFSCSASALVYNAGRSISERFGHVLGGLDALVIIPPDESIKRLHERALEPEALTAPLAADLGKAMDADFAVMGSVQELEPDWHYLSATAGEDSHDGRQAQEDISLFSKNQVFRVEAAMVDVRSSSIIAHAQFEIHKLKPPPSNTLGLQAIYIPGDANEAVQAASAMSFCDLHLALLGADLWKEPELLQNDNAGALEGALLSVGFFADSTDPTTKRFVDEYKARYADIPGQLAGQAYDAASIMAKLLKGGASSREELKDGLLSLHRYPGVTGATSFDGRQDAVKELPILRVNSVSKTFEQVQ